MPRPMIKRHAEQEEGRLSASKPAQQHRGKVKDAAALQHFLRQRRSPAYMALFHGLDAGGHVANARQVEAILEGIQAELPEIEISSVLLGIVAKCYLGNPYEVHTLDVTGTIIQHYKMGQPLPNGLERARNLAVSGDYAFIEVYRDCCCAVDEDGFVSIVS